MPNRSRAPRFRPGPLVQLATRPCGPWPRGRFRLADCAPPGRSRVSRVRFTLPVPAASRRGDPATGHGGGTPWRLKQTGRRATHSAYEHAGMPKTGNWWSAFVIGLAGTILVTGIGPTMVVGLGASAIPIMVSDHRLRLGPVHTALRAGGDDARAGRRPAVVHLPGVQGPLANAGPSISARSARGATGSAGSRSRR